jgi:predicted acylesterase/phospholipase RssA
MVNMATLMGLHTNKPISFVCAVTGYESTAIIRSYDIGRYDQLFDICRIWEAARATSAASTLFDPITIGPYKRKFVDGALRHNNPINLVDLEASGKNYVRQLGSVYMYNIYI